MKALGTLCNAFLDLIYPPACLHCKGGLSDSSKLLCGSCLPLLEQIDPVERCPYCFSSHFCPEQSVCAECRKRHPILNGLGAVFDYAGPAASLVRKLKYSNQPHLAEGCGAYLAAQFLLLEWPMPDLIVPVPIAFTHWLERGYNQSMLIADSLSKIIQRPAEEMLVRKSGDYSQAGLSHTQRMNLEGSSIFLKKPGRLQDKCILLIDDVMTTGSTMRRCAEALLADCPASIYGLAVCKAL